MESKSSKGQMSWWQLFLIGVGCTLGTGFSWHKHADC